MITLLRLIINTERGGRRRDPAPEGLLKGIHYLSVYRLYYYSILL